MFEHTIFRRLTAFSRSEELEQQHEYLWTGWQIDRLARDVRPGDKLLKSRPVNRLRRKQPIFWFNLPRAAGTGQWLLLPRYATGNDCGPTCRTAHRPGVQKPRESRLRIAWLTRFRPAPVKKTYGDRECRLRERAARRRKTDDSPSSL